MYEYKYVHLQTGGAYFRDNQFAAHRSIIDEAASEGWRYVGFIPKEFTSQGGIYSIDLIFERPVAATEE